MMTRAAYVYMLASKSTRVMDSATPLRCAQNDNGKLAQNDKGKSVQNDKGKSVQNDERGDAFRFTRIDEVFVIPRAVAESIGNIA